MKRPSLLVLFLLLHRVACGQGVAGLSRQQMREDYDFLVAKIEQISPHLQPKKELWGLDIVAQIKSRRAEIDTITTRSGFWYLVSRALQNCQDGHTGIRTRDEASGKNFADFNINLPFKYFDGSYYAIKPFAFEGQLFPIGTIATHFNGQDIRSYVQTLPQYRYFMQWDVANHCFYHNSFYATDNIARAKQFALTLRRPDQTTANLHFTTRDTVRIPRSQAVAKSIKKVEFWDAQNTLYIRVPEMNSDDIPFYKKQIAALAKNKNPEKIIIDIRNNLGGSDAVWQALYSSIIAQPLRYRLKLAGNKPDFMSKKYLREKELSVAKIKPETVPFLNNHLLYTYCDELITIKPSSKSIRFRGKIMVVGNENIYSSAGSCMLLPNADAHDNIISIGRATGRFLGGGYDPIVCELPHSKIQFNIEPAIDLTDAANAQGVMHDAYEHNIAYTLEEFVQKFNYKGDTWGVDFLTKHDPFIKKALAL